MKRETAALTLPLWGEAHLERDGARIRLGRKGLAILYYLAIEGSASRDTLANLLWEEGNGRASLRVELHRLREQLSHYDRHAFAGAEDPLLPPEGLEVDDAPRPGEPLEGLDDVSFEYQAWLEVQRARLAGRQGLPPVLRNIIEGLAQHLRPPTLVVVLGLPGAGQRRFAESLAERIRLPFIDGLHGTSPAVRLVRAPFPDNGITRVLADRTSVFVVERPPFGETPRFLLGLLAEFPAGQVHQVVLPPLPWSEARRGPLRGLDFPKAAQAYLESGGNLGQLLGLTEAAGASPAGALQPLQRVRARIENEARFLSLEARLALERSSVHPGPLPGGLLAALDLERHLDELERFGWMIYADGWHLISESVRRVIYGALLPGRRTRFHASAAEFFSVEGPAAAETYHRVGAGLSVDWEGLLRSLGTWARLVLEKRLGRTREYPPPTRKDVIAGGEIALTEPRLSGDNVELSGPKLVWTRDPMITREVRAEFSLEEGTRLLRVRGAAYIENPLGIGVSGAAVPLRLDVVGGDGRGVDFADVTAPSASEDRIILPLGESFEYWFCLPGGVLLALTSRAESAVFELEVSAFQTREHPGSGAAQRTAHAFALG